jgi:methylated-DNA-[protein]-cysteine S-methyltransferase
MNEPATFFTVAPSPLGPLTLLGEGDDLVGLYYPSDPNAVPKQHWRRDAGRLRHAVTQVDEYFAGTRVRFDLPLAPRGTPFQRAVWKLLGEIPFGQTASYGEIARLLGRPSASRAVGGANHRNPLAIVIPCHRVVGASGAMTGYGGGLDRKRLLLELEARVVSAGAWSGSVCDGRSEQPAEHE